MLISGVHAMEPDVLFLYANTARGNYPYVPIYIWWIMREDIYIFGENPWFHTFAIRACWELTNEIIVYIFSHACLRVWLYVYVLCVRVCVYSTIYLELWRWEREMLISPNDLMQWIIAACFVSRIAWAATETNIEFIDAYTNCLLYIYINKWWRLNEG